MMGERDGNEAKGPVIRMVDMNYEEKMGEYEKQEQRIARIFGKNEVPWVGKRTLRAYRDHIKKNLESPCYLTGIEDFPWEEYYIIGPGDKKEHEELRKTEASYLDTFELINIDEVCVERGIIAEVKRKTDDRIFFLPLADLKAAKKRSKNHELLHDYSVWFCNNR